MKLLTNGLFLFVLTLLVACAPDGEKVEAEEAKAVTETAAAETYAVDAAGSQIIWVGSKVTGEHSGTINITDGTLDVAGGNITGGRFVIDMNSINVTDLAPGQGKEKLEGHLKTGDFFEVETYPTAEFVITGSEAVTGQEDVTHRITGNLNMHGVTKSIDIPASVAMSNGVISAVAPQFTIDRNEWGVDFKGAEDNLISSQIGLSIQLKANKNAMGMK